MNVIPPIPITNAMLTSTTLVETPPAAYAGGTTYSINDQVSVAGSSGLRTIYKSLINSNTGNTPASSPIQWMNIGTTYQVYSSGTTYAIGDRVIDTTNHLVYESLVAGNIGNALTLATKWLLISYTNPWAMFDQVRNTQSTCPLSMQIVITPGQRIDSIALMGMIADNISINVTSAGGIFNYTENLNIRETFDWYDYFFNAFIKKNNTVIMNVPPYVDNIITVTLSVFSGNVSLGAFVIGNNVLLGDIQYSATSDVLNFSTVTRNFDGSTGEMIRRRNVNKTIQQIITPKHLINLIRHVRNNLNAVPAVWVGIDDNGSDFFESILILGFYKTFSINLTYPTHATISLELEEI